MLVSFLGFSQATLTINSFSSLQPNQKVIIPVMAAGMPSVCAISLQIKFNPSVLKFDKISDGYAGFSAFNCVNDQVYYSWFNGDPINLQNSKLFNLEFTYIAGESKLEFQTSSCALSDPNVKNYDIKYNDGLVKGSVSAVETSAGNITNYSLLQNYPNPFNPSTIIAFNLQSMGNTKIKVYNITGQLVTELLNKEMSAGYHQISFNAKNLQSGMYIYTIESGNYRDSRKMILLK